MAWGAGNYTTMNKILPGVYTNVKSKGEIRGVGADRGVVGIGIKGLTWGPEGAFKLTASEFYEDAEKYFGVNAMSDGLKGIRDLFAYAHTAYFYRLAGEVVKATSGLGTAKYGGTYGNGIKVIAGLNVDNPSAFDVEVFVGSKQVMIKRGVADTDDMPVNDLIVWTDGVAFTATTTNLTGGSEGVLDGTSEPIAYTGMMSAFEAYSEIDAIGCQSTIAGVKTAFVQYINRLVGEKGRTVQGVIFGEDADSENIVNVKNGVDLVYWATGAIGGCAVNSSLTGKKYGGEFILSGDYTTAQLEAGIRNGEFILHKVGSDLVVLKDINSLKTFTAEKGIVMSNNQVVRAMNKFISGVTESFARYDLGSTPNTEAGRGRVWNRVVGIGKELVDIGAFQPFSNGDVKVQTVEGDATAIRITAIMQPTQAIEKLYINLVLEG